MRSNNLQWFVYVLIMRHTGVFGRSVSGCFFFSATRKGEVCKHVSRLFQFCFIVLSGSQSGGRCPLQGLSKLPRMPQNGLKLFQMRQKESLKHTKILNINCYYSYFHLLFSPATVIFIQEMAPYGHENLEF